MDRPSYLTWLVEEENVIFNNGEPIKCYRLDYSNDEKVLDDWAVHIRRHYISDDELIDNCECLDITPEEYLRELVIPQRDEPFGGTARSNVISEILFSDLMEFVYGFEVPRYRQNIMSGKTVSEHGTDVIAYKFYNNDKTPDKRDLLVTVEVKAGLGGHSTDVIEKAVVDANKDDYRLAQSLDYMRRKLKMLNKVNEADDVLRFEKKTEADYHIDHYAAGMSSLEEIPKTYIEGREVKIIPEIDGEELRLKGAASVYYVHGRRLMELAHNLYSRCVK